MPTRVSLLLAVVLLAVSCVSDAPTGLDGFDTSSISIDGRELVVAVAETRDQRSQGLMGVTDLGGLDGMLFVFQVESNGGFWMKDTLIPLDIVWFLEDGTYAGRTSMEPCTTDECPTYTPGDGIDYRLAIEANAGDLDWIDESTVITYSD